MKKLKGSLSLEAVISFTVFISFMFMLMTIVKFAIIRVALNAAVSETAKQIATQAYPLSYLIEWEDSEGKKVELYEKEMKLMDGVENSDVSKNVGALFNLDEETSTGIVSVATKAKDILSGGDNAEAAANSLLLNGLQELEKAAGTQLICTIFNGCLDNSHVNFNKDNITVSIAKFPQSENAYKETGNSVGYTSLELEKDKDYNDEDVVVAAEYKYKIAFPFLPSFDITMREVAVEHAWLYGGNGTITSRDERLEVKGLADFIFGKGEKVYLGSMLTGKKYHKKDCRTLKRCGGIMTTQEIAEKDGYTPCKVCWP